MIDLSIFSYEFMQKAFIVGTLLALIIPCIGMIIVLKRLSMIGDALSHSSLAGVATGLILGINPIIGAVVACVIAALGIEGIRKKMPHYAELSIAIIMSAGIGLAGVLSGFVQNAANFNSFLFGSIVAISDFELILVLTISIIVLLTFILLYKELFFIAFDEQAAQLTGIPVKAINLIFTLMTAATISIAARTVGALIVSSLMVVPVACAMQIGRSYKQTVFYAIAFALFFTWSGLFISYYARLKPGGTIVLTGVVTLLLILLVKKIASRFTLRKATADHS
ncbi:MAG: metal ABC transporter permease [Clostridiaceae bacterium]|nr:metal ABC transporter permease [Clostridiaceae bacterium]